MAATPSRRNARTGLALAGLVAVMVGMAFVAVPLYRLYCQVTGYGGTTQTAAQAPAATVDRIMVVRFNADVDPKLPWLFKPDQRQVSLRVGETGLATFTARNLSDKPTIGAAVFNVSPAKAGVYFDKVQCFCFDEQHLAAGQQTDMTVSFFIDPQIMNDRKLDEVKTITLSYTFFRALDDPNRNGGTSQAAPPAKTQQSAAARVGAPATN